MIAFQDRKKMKPLEDLVRRVRFDKTKNHLNMKALHSKYSAEFASVIKDITGQVVDFYIKNSPDILYCDLNIITFSNPNLAPGIRKILTDLDLTEANDKTFKDQYKKYKKSIDEYDGLVASLDMENAKVSTPNSDLVTTVVMNIDVLVDVMRMTSAELTAGIIHELGHAWDYLEAIIRIRSTNGFMLDALRELRSYKNKDFKVTKYDIKLRKLGKKYSVDQEIMNNLDSSKDRAAYMVDLMRMTDSLAKSDTGSLAEDNIDLERAADGFAVRFGYGAELTTALLKMVDMDPEIIKKARDRRKLSTTAPMLAGAGSRKLMWSVLVVMASPLILIAGLAALLMAVYLGVYRMLIVLILAPFKVDLHVYEDYDRIEVRINRIYLGVLAELKKSTLTKKQTKAIVENLLFIKELGSAISKREHSAHMTVVRNMISFAKTGFAQSDHDTPLTRYMHKLQQVNTSDLYLDSALTSII